MKKTFAYGRGTIGGWDVTTPSNLNKLNKKSLSAVEKAQRALNEAIEAAAYTITTATNTATQSVGIPEGIAWQDYMVPSEPADPRSMHFTISETLNWDGTSLTINNNGEWIVYEQPKIEDVVDEIWDKIKDEV